MQSQAGLLYLTSTFAFRALSDAGAIVRRIILFSAAVACTVAQSPGTFITTGAMTTPPAKHAASLLLDGRALLTVGHGNSGEGSSIAEIYDPAAGVFTAAGAMLANRRMHSPTPLPDGHLLIVGGFGAGNSPAEFYDPASGAFVPTGTPVWLRAGHTAVLYQAAESLLSEGTHPR